MNVPVDGMLRETMQSGPAKPAIADARTVSTKDTYRAFCNEEPSVPLFARDWWLDATAGPDNWDVALVRKDSAVVAAMPYMCRNRYGMRVLSQPALSPILGPWLRQGDGSQARQLSTQNELMQALIDQLPNYDHFCQTWNLNLTNWQTFYWNGFKQTTYYTYLLPDLSDLDRLWNGLDSRVRRTIRKAENRFQLRVRDDLPVDVFLELNHKTFARQGLRPPYPDTLVRRLDAACGERNCRRIVVAVDPDGTPRSADYIVWDENSAYNIASGLDPEHRQSGANSLCIWESIRFAATVTRQYNLCGSMIQPVEAYMRLFGGTPMPYFCVSRTPSRLLAIRQSLLSMMGKE